MEDIHSAIREKRLADTGLWLFEHKSYKKWFLEEQAGPLWLFGPGMLPFYNIFHPSLTIAPSWSW
jgi:hypothetical protein